MATHPMKNYNRRENVATAGPGKSAMNMDSHVLRVEWPIFLLGGVYRAAAIAGAVVSQKREAWHHCWSFPICMPLMADTCSP